MILHLSEMSEPLSHDQWRFEVGSVTIWGSLSDDVTLPPLRRYSDGGGEKVLMNGYNFLHKSEISNEFVQCSGNEGIGRLRF